MIQSNKISNLINDKTFSDLSLTLIDEFNDNNKITLNVHKCILHVSCPFFEKLLTTFKEKNNSEISIKVSDIHIAHDIINSFYGKITNIANYNEILHKLESYKCYRYFMIDFDVKVFVNVKIHVEYFDLFLEVIESMENPDLLISTLMDNIPENYDLSTISKKILQKIYNTNVYVIVVDDHHINFYDKNLNKFHKENNKNFINFNYDTIGTKIIKKYVNSMDFYTPENKNLVKDIVVKFNGQCKRLVLTGVKNNIIICGLKKNCINNELVKFLPDDKIEYYEKFSNLLADNKWPIYRKLSDKSMLVVFFGDKIYISYYINNQPTQIDLSDNLNNYNINTHSLIDIYFIEEKCLLICVSNTDIFTIDLRNIPTISKKNITIKIFSEHFHITKSCITPDNSYIITTNGYGIYIYDIDTLEQIKKYANDEIIGNDTTDDNRGIIQNICCSPDQREIIIMVHYWQQISKIKTIDFNTGDILACNQIVIHNKKTYGIYCIPIKTNISHKIEKLNLLQ
ncbi:putative BTB/POZ domain and WD-repeat protein [Cotonvirus japonicus]|uniref:BTB/POZ domain and WD-repeat protein n=1 Tax=Cotonvirus japonicus TaxID=2811091 RepID=A0ABM7NTS8_9VIRU|nr:putative BTB/POZ domain and WD-repeat protein [Cotonvirus japonicus]BCS83573.1 putative BTB/POZ domain and WD-repeat protein [Cotonvirus japonicus]